MYMLTWLFLAAALLFEGTVTTVPLVLILLLCLILITREPWIFMLAFFCGIFIDIMTGRPYGLTSIFYLVFLFGVLLYERKYEIASLPFIIFSSFFGSLIYSYLFERQSFFLKGVVGCLFAVWVYMLYKRVRIITHKKHVW